MTLDELLVPSYFLQHPWVISRTGTELAQCTTIYAAVAAARLLANPDEALDMRRDDLFDGKVGRIGEPTGWLWA